MNDLLKRLRKGWLSSAAWFSEHDSLKLTSRISDARRAGYQIEQRKVSRNGKSWCEYRLAR